MRSIYVYTDSRDDSMGSLVVILAASSCTVSIFQHVACADLEGGRGGGPFIQWWNVFCWFNTKTSITAQIICHYSNVRRIYRNL